MALRVGIHKNLVLAKAEKNEKGTLVITLREGGVSDPLAILNSSSGAGFEKQEVAITLWPIKVEFNGQKRKKKDKEVDQSILDDVNDFKASLNLILKQYLTEDKINWNILFGTGITTPDNLLARITVQDTVDKIYNNLVDQFITQIKPFTGDKGKLLNWKLVRQSKAKHYPTLPKVEARFLASYPFVEDAAVPVSKLAYSKFELDRGDNVPDAVTGAQVVSKEEATNANALFANPV
jgi:hypothetical protein